MYSPKKAAVIVADPEPVSRLGLVALFNAQAGLRVVAEAESVAQVRALCQKWRPELLVIDPALDVGEGMAFLRELPRCSAGTRAVAFTGRVDAASVQAAIQAGACGFVARRDPAAALVAAVLAALRGERHLGPRVEALLLDGMAHGAFARLICYPALAMP